MDFDLKCQGVNQYSKTDAHRFIESSLPDGGIWQIENDFTDMWR